MTEDNDVSPGSAEDSAVSDHVVMTTTFKVGRYYKCTMTIDCAAAGEGIRAEWDPDLPNRRLTKAEMRDYRVGRDAFLLIAAKAMADDALFIET